MPLPNLPDMFAFIFATYTGTLRDANDIDKHQRTPEQGRSRVRDVTPDFGGHAANNTEYTVRANFMRAEMKMAWVEDGRITEATSQGVGNIILRRMSRYRIAYMLS